MSKKIDLALLIVVAKELQDLCEFDPPIKTKNKSEAELKKTITQAAEQLGPDDELSEDAILVFKELGITPGASAEAEGEEEEEEIEEGGEEGEEEEAVEEAPKKKAAAPAKKEKAAAPAADKGPKLSTQEKIEFFSPLIETGKYNTKELVEKSVEKFPGLSESSVRTFLVDSKNPKYNKFPNLVVADEEGKLSFARSEKAAPAKKAAAPAPAKKAAPAK
jgi:hypothetical protein